MERCINCRYIEIFQNKYHKFPCCRKYGKTIGFINLKIRVKCKDFKEI